MTHEELFETRQTLVEHRQELNDQIAVLENQRNQCNAEINELDRQRALLLTPIRKMNKVTAHVRVKRGHELGSHMSKTRGTYYVTDIRADARAADKVHFYGYTAAGYDQYGNFYGQKEQQLFDVQPVEGKA